MLTRLLFILLMAAAWPGGDDPDAKGREGNRQYAAGAYAAAEAAYRAGLAAYAERAPDATAYALLNNLGATLYRQEQFDEAADAFAQALDLAPAAADVARTAYNAGNTAFYRQNLDAALDFYRRALLADPENQDAKFNYEFVKRLQDQQQQQQGGGESDEQQDQEQNPQDQENEGDQQQQQDPSEGANEPQQQDPQEQSAQPQPQQTEQLSRQQAERILQALEDDEQQLLREIQKMKGRPRRVEKDW